ncbi:hypothetical protein D9M68_658320 [compost metagenome]
MQGPRAAHDTRRQPVSFGEGCLAGRGRDHWRASSFGKVEERLVCAAVGDAAAEHHQRSLGLFQQLDRLGHALRIGTGAAHAHVGRRIRQAVLGNQCVLDVKRDRHDHRARTPGQRRLVGPQEHVDAGIGASCHHRLLADRPDRPGEVLRTIAVGFLDASTVEPVRRTDADQNQHADGLVVRRGHRRHDVGVARTNARRHDGQRRAALVAPVAVCQLHGLVFHARADALDLGVVDERVKQPPVAVSVQAEDELRAHLLEQARNRRSYCDLSHINPLSCLRRAVLKSQRHAISNTSCASKFISGMLMREEQCFGMRNKNEEATPRVSVRTNERLRLLQRWMRCFRKH